MYGLPTLSRKLRWLGSLGLLLVATGCGGGSNANSGPSSGSKNIQAAQDALKNAEYAASTNSFNEADSSIETARRKISEGKMSASANEKARLDDLSKQLSSLVASIDLKRQTYLAAQRDKKSKEEQDKKIAELEGDKSKTADPAAKKKAETEAAAKAADKKKAEAEEAKRKAAEVQREKDLQNLAVKKTEPVKNKKEEDDGDAPAVAAAGGKDAAPGEAPKPAAPVKVGPYKTYGANPPKLTVDELRLVRGQYVFAYIQVFNTQDVGKRIGSIDVTFKDAGNAVLFDRVGTFEFSGFRENLGDPTEQTDSKCALTGGSHEVPGGGVLQLVAVGHDAQRAARAKKASVTINFEDGSSASESGPSSVMIEQEKPKPAMKGLKDE